MRRHWGQLSDPAPGDMDGHAALEEALAVDLGVFLERFPAMPISRIQWTAVFHSPTRVSARSRFTTSRHAVEVGHEIAGAVGRDRHAGEQRVVKVRHESPISSAPACTKRKPVPE